MKQHSQKLYKTVQDFYQSCVSQLMEIEKALDDEIDVAELADYAYALRESANSLEALEKALRKAQTIRAEKKLAYLQITQAPTENIQTKYCTVCIDPTTAMRVPKLSELPEVYFAMCADLGIREDLAQIELFRVHYPGFERYCTQLAAEGLPVPKWAETLTEYNTLRVKLIKRKNTNILDGYVA